MATSQGFNKPKTDYLQVNRKKKQEKKKRMGVAQKGKAAALAVSAVRTKKHARKVDHRKRMSEKDAKREEQAVAAAAAAAEAKAASEDVEMAKVRVKKPKAKAAKAMQH